MTIFAAFPTGSRMANSIEDNYYRYPDLEIELDDPTGIYYDTLEEWEEVNDFGGD